MPLPKSDYLSDTWKDGLFSELLHANAHELELMLCSEQGRLLHRWSRHNLQRAGPRSRQPRRQRMHCRQKR
jgi:hypothetical protein